MLPGIPNVVCPIPAPQGAEKVVHGMKVVHPEGTVTARVQITFQSKHANAPAPGCGPVGEVLQANPVGTCGKVVAMPPACPTLVPHPCRTEIVKVKELAPLACFPAHPPVPSMALVFPNPVPLPPPMTLPQPMAQACPPLPPMPPMPPMPMLMPPPPAPPLPPMVHPAPAWVHPPFAGPRMNLVELVPPPIPVHLLASTVPPAPPESDEDGTILTSKIHIVREGGRSRLELEDSDGCCATCVRMGYKVGPNSKVTVAAGAKQVHVSGLLWKASADEVQILDGGKRVALSGHVKMTSEKASCRARLAGEDVEIVLKEGQIEQIIQTNTPD
jgi:hypothetical protein